MYKQNEGALMKQTVKICNMTGLDSSLRELETAKLVILMAPSPVFKDCVQRMGELIPTVTNIGVCGQGYYELKDHPEDIILIGYYECEAVADVIVDVTKPILSVQKMKEHMNAIQANAKNTVCLDFTTGNDSVIVTTLNACLSERDIALIGATAWDNKVSFNGRLYENACVYALLKNTNGTIRAYMENIYVLDENMPSFVATKIDEASQKIITLDGKSAASVYQEALGIRESDIESQTFKNPIGREVGEDIYIISIKSHCPDGSLECYKRANHMDTLTILRLGDYDAIIKDTVSKIKSDMPSIKGVFSVNCILRYMMFNDMHYMGDYLGNMNQLGNHVGLVGCGEHFRTQHVNQTMTCLVFD